MHSSLINLLSSERIRAFQQGYFYRLGTVIALSLAFMLMLHAMMLAPAYFTLAEAKANETTLLQSVKERLSSAGDQEITERLAALGKQTEHLVRLAAVPSATATMREVLLLPRSGITLTGLSFTPPAGKTGGQLRLTGTAVSRDALRSYQSTLGTLPTVTNVDLPISAFAKESDIPFTITLTGSFSPVSP
ncbi:hypothetical protein K2Y00_02975 [Patescibacteria group bacterium]|nr:hypothetical protein [Patescibacteria group bacterium]